MIPLISIIIPTYNRAHLIGTTLDSIAKQTHTRWECLIIDDGSTDNTKEVVTKYVKDDNRFQYHQRPLNRPKGANACRNYGFEISNGEYINWFDDDDVMLPTKLELQIKVLIKNHKAPYCICQTQCVDMRTQRVLGLRSSEISSKNKFEDYILYKIFWLTTAPLWRREFLMKHQLIFDETLHQSQEYDFHIKALAIDAHYQAIDEPLVQMYIHEGNLSNQWQQDEAKVYSNIKVKQQTLKNYRYRLQPTTQLKLLEMLTLLYKDLLSSGNYKVAFKAGRSLRKSLNYVSVPIVKKCGFYLKTLAIYWSYRIFGKGYNLLKPIDVF